MNKQQNHEDATLILSHEFNAPKELVFNAFSDAEALNAWWGPVEMNNSVVSLDFNIGGIFHYKMEGQGQVNYGRFKFSKIEPHDLLEYTTSFTDEKANIIKPPFDIAVPKEIFNSLSFSEQNGKTTITLNAWPVNANEEEVGVFKAIYSSMEQGFGKTFDQLTVYLNKGSN